MFFRKNDQNIKVSISTLNKEEGDTKNLIGSPICVRTLSLAEDYINAISSEKINSKIPVAPVQAWLLIGTFMHDYARHFGLFDEDHILTNKHTLNLFLMFQLKVTALKRNLQWIKFSITTLGIYFQNTLKP